MSFQKYRPWGLLEWIAPRLPERSWTFIGCIATGERSIAGWMQTRSVVNVTNDLQFLVHDEESALWADGTKERLADRKQQYLDMGGSIASIRDYDILQQSEDIEDEVLKAIDRSKGSVFLDISAMPKRFFFPICRLLIANSTLREIVILYTEPESYARDLPLAIGHQKWDSIHTFREMSLKPIKKPLIVSLGYEVLGLPELIHEGVHSESKVNFLLPFPSSSGESNKNWDVLRRLRPYLGKREFSVKRIDSLDVASTYEAILQLTSDGVEHCMLAPFGTKTMSLAMCLYACRHFGKSSVYYSQPTSYNPMYSVGVKRSFAYCLRIKSMSYY